MLFSLFILVALFTGSFVLVFICKCAVSLRERGYNGLFITVVPKVLIIKFSYSLASKLELVGSLIYKFKCPNVFTTNCNQQKVQFCVSTLEMYINLSAIALSL